MDEVTLRRLAIRQFERGERPAVIWPRLGRSRRWFFKWLARYRAGGPDALLGQSRAHHRHPRTTSPTMRAAIEALRDQHDDWGERTIARELPAHVVGPTPGHTTVSQVLRASGQIGRRRPRTVPTVRYPRLVPAAALELVEHDFFGPRWIVGFGRVFGYQSMDVFSRSVSLGAQGDKTAPTQLAYWLALFQRFGLPQVVQTDNEFGLTSTAMRGSFTRVTRLFLALGIEHRFIPAGEPYRNGHIERSTGPTATTSTTSTSSATSAICRPARPSTSGTSTSSAATAGSGTPCRRAGSRSSGPASRRIWRSTISISTLGASRPDR